MLSNPALREDPYPFLAELRQQGPLVPIGLNVRVATTRAACDELLRNRALARVFIEREPSSEWSTFNWLHADSVLDSEPPKHTRLRRLIAGAFGRGHMARLEPSIEQICRDQLADAGAALRAGEWDLVRHYAEPIPVKVISALLDWPEADHDLLRPWSQAIVQMYEFAPSDEAQAAARRSANEFASYVSELADARAGGDGADLISHLVQVRDGSDRLTRHELIATVVLLLNAGHEASANGFGNGMLSLLGAAGAQDTVRGMVARKEPLDRVVEEMLRHDPPLQYFERTATQDTTVAGEEVLKGEKVAALLGAAARDPEAYPDPDAFLPTRLGPPQLGFGAGIHFCLGAPLARLEMQTSLRVLLEATSDLRVTNIVRRPTFVLRGCERIELSGEHQPVA